MSAEQEARLGEFIVRVIVVAVVAALAVLVWAVADVLLLLFAALLLAVLFRGLGAALRSVTGCSKGLALVVVVVALIIGPGALVWLFGGQIAGEFADLGRSIPELVRNIQADLEEFAWGRALLEQLDATGSATGLLARFGSVFGSAIGVAADLALIFFIALYLAAQPRHYARGVLELAPEPRRARIGKLLETLGKALWLWIVGKLASMAAVGVLTATGLLLLGMPSALALGLIAAVAELVPFFGPLLAAVPALLLAAAHDSIGPAPVLLLYLAIQQVESYVILPLIQKRVVSLPPALTLAAILAFGVLFGPLGVLLAEALAVTGLILVKVLYIEDALGRHTQVPGRDARA